MTKTNFDKRQSRRCLSASAAEDTRSPVPVMARLGRRWPKRPKDGTR